MTNKNHIVVIGAGPGGYAAAFRAAALAHAKPRGGTRGHDSRAI